jgi:hypothetical protein
MANDEWQMTNGFSMTNDENTGRAAVTILHSFVIRHSSFVISERQAWK